MADNLVPLGGLIVLRSLSYYAGLLPVLGRDVGEMYFHYLPFREVCHKFIVLPPPWSLYGMSKIKNAWEKWLQKVRRQMACGKRMLKGWKGKQGMKWPAHNEHAAFADGTVAKNVV